MLKAVSILNNGPVKDASIFLYLHIAPKPYDRILKEGFWEPVLTHLNEMRGQKVINPETLFFKANQLKVTTSARQSPALIPKRESFHLK